MHAAIPERYYQRLGKRKALRAEDHFRDDPSFFPLAPKVRQVDWHGKYTAGSGVRNLHGAELSSIVLESGRVHWRPYRALVRQVHPRAGWRRIYSVKRMEHGCQSRRMVCTHTDARRTRWGPVDHRLVQPDHPSTIRNLQDLSSARAMLMKTNCATNSTAASTGLFMMMRRLPRP